MNLSDKFLSLGPENWLTFGQMFEGTMIVGGTGSGKTTSSGASIAHQFLSRGFGGLVLTAKGNEVEAWVRYARRCGRSEDLILVNPSSGHSLDFLAYEASRVGRGAGLTAELVNILLTSLESGRPRQKSLDAFWDDAVAQLLTNAIDMLSLAGARLTLADIIGVIREAPTALDQALRGSYNMAAGAAADEVAKVPGNRDRYLDLHECRSYFEVEFAGLDPKPRSSILMMVMARLSGLLRTPFRQLLCTRTTFVPEDTFERRKIVVLDLPIKEYGDVGKLAQILIKTIWQRAVERRDPDGGNPVFLWADEAQYFVSKYDLLFQQTARSSRVGTVYLTQSVANLRAALDDSHTSNASEALLGNFQTKIFHANGCPVTNEWGARLFGSTVRRKRAYSPTPFSAEAKISRPIQVQLSQQREPLIDPSDFIGLKKDGKDFETIIFQSGRRWNGTFEWEKSAGGNSRTSFALLHTFTREI